MKQALHPFDPIVFDDSEVLILGSFPSLKSFENGFYYAHPKNQFWKILSDIYSMPISKTDEKITLIKKAKIALWDTIKSCERENSSDAKLKNIEPNDIEGLLHNYQNIDKIFFTGKTAQKLYEKYFSHLNIYTALLPSTSPAYASMKFEEKLSIWKNALIR